MNISEEQIKEWLDSEIEDNSIFVVEIEIKGEKGGKKKIIIYLDGDEGLSIEQCTKISRKLGKRIEESEFVDENLILEVSSFGVGRPLKLFRQYLNNVGRKLKVDLEDGKSLEGILKEAQEDRIVLEKKKKKEIQSIEIEMKDIKSTQVLVSFN